MAEANGFVLQRAMNDLLAGTVRAVDGQIDFNSYLREYWLCMLMADFAAWCRRLQPEQETIVKATTQDVVVFGGTG